VSSAEQPEAPAPTISFAAQAKFNAFYTSAAVPVSLSSLSISLLMLMLLLLLFSHDHVVAGLYQALQLRGDDNVWC
jgi:hypothetical protein